MTVSDTSQESNHSWLQDNVLDPAGTALKESANAGINLVNLALSPTDHQLSKFEVTHNPEASATASLVTGLVSALPYALAGGVVGRVMHWLPMGESAAMVLRNSSFTQIAGAAGLDGMRDLRPGETTFGNVLGTSAGMGVFELGNSRMRGLSLLASLPLRAGVGVVGGIAQSTFSDLGSGRAPDVSRWTDAGITGGGTNVLLPTLQYAVARTFRLPAGAGASAARAGQAEAPIAQHGTGSFDAAGAEVGNVGDRTATVHTEQSVAVQPLDRPLELVPDAKMTSAAEAMTPAEIAPPAPPPPTVDLNELPAFAVLTKIGERIRWVEQQRQIDSPDMQMPRSTVRDMQHADAARANMQQIAEGKLPTETQDYIARGWLPADTLEQMQARLRGDLEQAHLPGKDTTNVEDMAAYSHKYTRERYPVKGLIDAYQGSMTRLALRTFGVESNLLGRLNDHANTLELEHGAADSGLADLRRVADIGADSVDVMRAGDVRRSIAAIERSLANPETREATLAELERSQMNYNPLLRKYAPADRALNREPGPVDLTQHNSWQYAYRLLGRLQENREGGVNGMAQQDAAVWAGRSLRHMEEIANGDFPPAVLQVFEQKPEFLNNMRAQLEHDLRQEYFFGTEPFSKQDPAVTLSQFFPLLQKYEQSPINRFIEATSQVPTELTHAQSNLRFDDPRRTVTDTQLGWKMIYAIERGLIDPEKRSATYGDLVGYTWTFGRPPLLDRYAKIFDKLYASEQPLRPLGDYSQVVRFQPRPRNGTS